jgi:PAS domain S-box-containing protein
MMSDDTLRLQAVIDTVIDGILTIDEKGIVESVNPAGAKLFGYSAGEIIGNNINMLMPSPYREEHDGYLQRYLKTNIAHIIGIGREVKGKRKDGTVFPLRLAVSEVFLDQKRIFTGVIHDLTEVKEAEKKIIKLNEELETQNQKLEQKVSERTEKLANVVNQLLSTNNQLEKEISERKDIENALLKSQAELKQLLENEKELSELKSRFVSMASHEFRTPLSTILSSIELVEAYKKAEQQPNREKHIGRIKNTVNHLTSILNDFLSLSRLEEGHIQAEPETFVLKDFCEDLIDEFQEQLKPKQRLQHNGLSNGREILLDKKCLKNILFNLLSNASKYSGEEATIYCETELSEGLLKISIQDEGIGIPSEDQKHLFTRFFRAHNVENIKGTGLGLHIVRRYVDLLNGSISFDSIEGKGTTFYIEIPLE